ncbi:high-mobility group box 6 [Wolffia australiana]
MAGSQSNPPRPRKRVEVNSSALKRARDGSAFTKCEACGKDVPVGLIDMHSCSLDSKIRMTLESQVVESAPEVKEPAEKKKKVAAPSVPKREKSTKREKKAKDPNKPKRPPTAFFLFMDDFRKTYKEANPDSKNVSLVAKEGGEKWKSMTDEEKKPYIDKAAELKAEYKTSVEKQSTDNEENEASPGQEEEEDATADEA